MSDLDRLFYWRGIAADYFNYRGEHVNVTLANRTNLLRAMGVDVDDHDTVAREAYRLDVEPWQHWLTKICVEPVSEDVSFDINLGPDDYDHPFEWQLYDTEKNVLGAGQFRHADLEESGEYIYDGTRFSRCRVKIGRHEPGYYSLSVSSQNKTETTVLALHPEKVYAGNSGEKMWGVIVQLYTLRSDRNWGIGDFSDLRRLLEIFAPLGADTVGLNPLHTLSSDLDTHFSPYNPSDRRFLSPLYIDVESVPEFDHQFSSGLDQELLHRLQRENRVNYPVVRDLKYSYFQGMFKAFVYKEMKCRTARAEAFFQYVERGEKPLLRFACYEAKSQHWKNALFVLDDSHDDEVIVNQILVQREGCNEPEQLAVLFHCYLQWLAEMQLESCQQLATSLGMKIGIIRDLAVGADGSGSEVSANASLFCRRSAIGAPPDPFAQTGQNWGMPPMMPSELRNSGFEHFIQLLKANMAHCGALRIDHAMSLMRLWWCPPDETAAEGAYVYYPFREMLGLLTLESHLNQCCIIGEDLGVVPDDFREAIVGAGIITNKVFYFEKVDNQDFKAPEAYEKNALAMINNHDLPTLVSWWDGTDIELRNELSLLEEGVDYHDVCRSRAADKSRLLSMLYEYDCYPSSWHGKPIESKADRALVHAIMIFLSRVNANIFVIQLEDLLMMDEPVNVPGTFHEHANWQRKLSLSAEQLLADKSIVNLLNEINQHRKNN